MTPETHAARPDRPARAALPGEETLLRLRGISKSFGPVRALTGVDLDIPPGQVTALVGDNGAGKSTLIKTVSGIWSPDEGELHWNGQEVHLHSPRDAAALGIQTVYQDLALCNNLDIVQNMFLGRESTHLRLLDEPSMETTARRTLEELSVTTVQSIRQPVGSLSGGQRQSVAVARAVMWDAQLVIMDEPTAALGVAQTATVLDLIRRLASRGIAVLVISHNLNDVFAVADRVAVLYLGRMAFTGPLSIVDQQDVVQMITSGSAPPDVLSALARIEDGEPGETRNGGEPAATTPPRAEAVVASDATAETAGPTEPLVGLEDEAAADTALPATEAGLRGYAKAWWRRVRAGESGVLPVVAGLIIIIAIFQYENSAFLTPGNIVNLLVQGSPFVLLGMAEVFVLLLAEIDLSIGYIAGITAVVMATLATDPYNLGWVVAVAAGLAAAAAIGLLQGGLVTRLGLPSFVVTLAGLLGWEGVLIALVSAQSPTNGGTIRITNNVILDFVNGSMSVALGWILTAAAVGLFGAFSLIGDARRRRSGLVTAPLALTLLKIGATAVAGIVLVVICNRDRGIIVPIRGMPWVVPIVIAFLVAWTILLGRTRFGRYFYAIGGNPEAARRAGIDVRGIRLAGFVLCGLTAGIGGVIYASRLGSISTGVDGGTLVLFAIAAAVIGGTSLFGGRGKMVHALLGGLVVATIFNGMGLIGLAADSQDIVTALVLLAAVAVDALVSRTRTA